MKKGFLVKISHKVSETNSRFDVKEDTTKKVQLLFLGSVFIVLRKSSFLQEHWTLGYHSMKFRHFANIS